MARTLIKISVIYFAIGIGLGYYMSVAGNHTLTGVHVHINLLGWVSLALAGLIYHLYPKLATNSLGKIHFWLHNIGLPIMMGALTALLLTGNESLITGIAVGATITSVGVFCFVINVLLNLKAE